MYQVSAKLLHAAIDSRDQLPRVSNHEGRSQMMASYTRSLLSQPQRGHRHLATQCYLIRDGSLPRMQFLLPNEYG